MKLLIFVISFFIVAAHSQPRSMDWKGCMEEIGVSKDDVKSTEWGDPKSRCVLACTFKKVGVINDGKVVFDVAFDITKGEAQDSSHDKYIEEKVNSCIEKAHQETNECDVSYVFMECMKTNNNTAKMANGTMSI
ncbi:pheromone-binding protein Gp-9 [Nasonia vitripennis]